MLALLEDEHALFELLLLLGRACDFILAKF